LDAAGINAITECVRKYVNNPSNEVLTGQGAVCGAVVQGDSYQELRVKEQQRKQLELPKGGLPGAEQQSQSLVSEEIVPQSAEGIFSSVISVFFSVVVVYY